MPRELARVRASRRRCDAVQGHRRAVARPGHGGCAADLYPAATAPRNWVTRNRARRSRDHHRRMALRERVVAHRQPRVPVSECVVSLASCRHGHLVHQSALRDPVAAVERLRNADRQPPLHRGRRRCGRISLAAADCARAAGVHAPSRWGTVALCRPGRHLLRCCLYAAGVSALPAPGFHAAGGARWMGRRRSGSATIHPYRDAGDRRRAVRVAGTLDAHRKLAQRKAVSWVRV